MTITKQDIKNASDEFLAAKQRLADVQQAYAEQECPYNIGDPVTINGKGFVVEGITYGDLYCEWIAFSSNGMMLTKTEYEQEGK